ncbi:MAG TPA: hypothetical protein VH599_20685 [Ktedonobacterales bacterium]|jgi:hypothetical protein
MKPETQAALERAAQADALLYDTSILIDVDRAWAVLVCEDQTLRGKTAAAFARWLRQRGLLPQAGQYAPWPNRPRQRRALYQLADLLALVEQLTSQKAVFDASMKRRASAKAAHPRAAVVQATRTRQATAQALAGFDAEALALLERLRRLDYPRAAAVRAIQQTPRTQLLALLERVEAGVQSGALYRPAAYLAAALEER